MKSTHLVHILGALSYVTTILFVVEQFFPNEHLILTYSIFAAILLLSAFLVVSNVTRIVVAILLGIGGICFYLENTSSLEVVAAFGKNANILALFLLIPLIGTFLSTSGYLSALKEKVQEKERQGERHPYRLSFLLTSVTGILLNFGTMAIVKRIADESLTAFQHKKMTLIIMRAFGLCMLFSPYFVNVGLVMILFNLSWIDIGGYGLLLGIIYLVVNWLMFRRIHFSNDPIIERKIEEPALVRTKQVSLLPVYIFGVSLVALSFVLEYVLHVHMITVVSMLAIVFPLVWAVVINMLRSYIHDVVEMVENSFLRLKNEIAIFVSAGFFGFALSKTTIGITMSNLLLDVSLGSVYLLSWLLVLIAIGLAQIGIHPVIIVIGIGSALSPANFGISPEYMAILLIISWSLATQISPFSGQVLMASRLMNQPPSVIIKQNYQLTCVLSVIFITVIYGLYKLGWL